MHGAKKSRESSKGAEKKLRQYRNNRNCPFGSVRIKIEVMGIGWKCAVVGLFCGVIVCASWAQESSRETGSATAGRRAVSTTHARPIQRMLTVDEGLGVISAALDPKVRRFDNNDCSHMVQAIYERAGFPYMYATSSDLYEGVQGFRKVAYPQPGDVVVWHRHAGIVVRPSHHEFFSFMSHGAGVDHYDSTYWAGRGIPRFYRYIKNHPCAGCTSVRASYRREREE